MGTACCSENINRQSFMMKKNNEDQMEENVEFNDNESFIQIKQRNLNSKILQSSILPSRNRVTPIQSCVNITQRQTPNSNSDRSKHQEESQQSVTNLSYIHYFQFLSDFPDSNYAHQITTLNLQEINKTVMDTYKQFGAYKIQNCTCIHQGPYGAFVTYYSKYLNSQILRDGTKYEGQWHHKLRYGHGKAIFADHSFYEGEWKNDQEDGMGRLIYPNGDLYVTLLSEGHWFQGKAEGQGTYIKKEGIRMSGFWYQDKLNGQGIEQWNDGSIYQGGFKNGKKHGYGKFSWKDGASYEGEFEMNEFQGYGEYNWKDGRKYKGDWFKGKMEGKGELIWKNNQRYEGQFENDERSGFGIFYWEDKRVYKGFWKNGKQNGAGVLIDKDGKEYHGEWYLGQQKQNTNID